MHEIVEYLKACGTFYLATDEDGQPRVRPFGASCEFEGKLYIVTNNQKKVYRQMKKNPNVEISGMHSDGTWIRIAGTMAEDLRKEARVAMLEENPGLGRMYSADDGLMTVFAFEHGEATFSSFSGDLKVLKF